MESGDQSLVLPEQDELFDRTALPSGLELLVPEPEQRKRFTAEQVAKNRARYLGIVAALGQCLPVRMICQAFTVSHHTVKVIREREPSLVATEKQRMSRVLGHAARLSAEAFIEDLIEGVPHRLDDGTVIYRPVPSNVKAVAVGIFLDKKAMLDGEATSRIEHVRAGVPTLEEVKRAIEALPDSQSDVSEVKAA